MLVMATDKPTIPRSQPVAKRFEKTPCLTSDSLSCLRFSANRMCPRSHVTNAAVCASVTFPVPQAREAVAIQAGSLLEPLRHGLAPRDGRFVCRHDEHSSAAPVSAYNRPPTAGLGRHPACDPR